MIGGTLSFTGARVFTKREDFHELTRSAMARVLREIYAAGVRETDAHAIAAKAAELGEPIKVSRVHAIGRSFYSLRAVWVAAGRPSARPPSVVKRGKGNVWILA